MESNRPARLSSLVEKFVKFGVVGFSGMVVDYGVLLLLKEVVGLKSFLAVAAAFAAAASSNYCLNRVWTFRSKNKQVGREYLCFICVSIVGLGITELTIWICGLLLPMWMTDWRFYALKFAAIVATTLWNFVGNLLFTFRHSAADNS